MNVKFLFIAILLLSISYSNIFSQDWGIGVRLGDPSGITIKKHSNNKALELSVGRTHTFTNNGYYDNKFKDFHPDINYTDIQYVDYKASTPLSFQFHYLIQKPINKVENINTSGLFWYYGFGAQFRFQTYTFNYRYRLLGSNDWIYATGEKVTDYDIGPDGVIGLEYTFMEAPISLFLDVTLFMEIVNDPFMFWFQGGIGVRYKF